MKSIILRVAGLAAVLALATAAAASAHPGIYTVTQKLATGAITYGGDPTGAGLSTTTQYVVANDGYAVGFTETAGSGTVGGMLNYKTMPTAYRKDMTPDQKRTYGPAQTLLQPHARCEGVPELDPNTAAGGANILAWQLLPGTTVSSGGTPVPDPYFNYIPWQKTGVTVSGAPAGANTNVLGEDPSFWIPVVKSATATLAGAPAGGVDLAALSTAQDFIDACTAIGGTYRKADAASSIANSLITGAVAPVQAQVTSLQGQLTTAQDEASALHAQLTTLQGDNDTLTTGNKSVEDKAAAALAAQLVAESRASAALAAQGAAETKAANAEAARAALLARKLALTLPSKRLSATQPVAMATGPAGASATLTLRVGRKQQTALGLASPVLATVKKPIAADGALLVTLAPGRAAAKALAKAKGAVPVTVDVSSGGASASATAALTS